MERKFIFLISLYTFLLFLMPINTFADSRTQLEFKNIASDPASGLNYARIRSPIDAIFQNYKEQSIANPPTPYTFAGFIDTPEKSRGAPGIAVLDVDNDGDLDIYVTNGPGVANSLFKNQLNDSAVLTFIDTGNSSGANATHQDSTGVCFGDIDNDGDQDLYVLGRSEANRLLINQGNGNFVEKLNAGGASGGTLGHTSCSMGDIDGDGLLDIAVANSFDWTSREAIFVELFAFNDHNQLFRNKGNHQFEDVSQSSGMLDLKFATNDGAASITWGIGMVDYDLDGDTDIIHTDDQAALTSHKEIDPSTGLPGVDRGYIRVLQNNGMGHFTDVTPMVGTNTPGQWMGITFADFNCDGNMDIFGTNMGSYASTALPIPVTPEDAASRWFLGRSDGTFDDPGIGQLNANPFGWGPSALDYDNDGDTDIVYFGSLDAAGPVITADNPGALLTNENCSAQFTRNATALNDVNHHRRNVQGSAVGDINNDGFVDILSVSASDYPEPIPLMLYPVQYASAFDDTAFFQPIFAETGPGEFTWLEYEQIDGSLTVQISSADNGNHWIKVKTVGSKGLVTDGKVNRDGIGAVVSFTPHLGRATLKPIVGGSSHGSQDELIANFGLGKARYGTIDVLWPGGTRNRLYHARQGKLHVQPEIPCSYDANWPSLRQYMRCVNNSLASLLGANIINQHNVAKLRISALRAYVESRHFFTFK